MYKFGHMVILGITLFAAASVFARPATQDEQAQISARMVAFLDAMESGRHEEVAEISIAPRVWTTMSTNMGMDIEQLRPAIASQMKSIMGQFEMSNIAYDISAVDLTDTESLSFGYFPNSFDVTVGDDVTHIENPVFALKDEGQWYILRIDPQQLPVLQGAYPELAGLAPPETTVSVSEKR